MALVLKDRVKVTCTTTGTGTLTLAGATTGYQSFETIGNGNTTYYVITDPATGDWEVGLGEYTSIGTTLSRDVILSSSNAGSVVNLQAGTKEVFCAYPAEKAIYEEENGETLIDGGPITVIGNGVTSIPSLPAELGKFVGNANLFTQIYCMNQNTGTSASADFVAYNNLTTDGYTNFIDMGINSSNYTSVDYPIFTPGSGYLFHDGDHLYIGTATTNKDVVIFTGGVDTPNEAMRILGTDQSVELVGNLSVGGTLTVTGAAEFQSTVLLDADPTLALQAATKQYVDNATSNGFHVHTPVLVATTGNLTATYNNGTSGVGATLTNSGAQAALSIDGVSLSVNDRVLVWQQTTGTQNGVYVVTTVGSGSTNWVLTRASDADTAGESDPDALGGGDYFFVSSGATLGFFSFVCTNTTTITFGSTNITFTVFSQVPSYVVNAPLNLTGNTLSLTGTVAATNGGTGVNTVTTGDLLYGSASNTWSKLAAGSQYQSLLMGAALPYWGGVALDQANAVSGTLPATYGGTGFSTYVTGDTLYSSATNTLSKLSGNTTTTPKYMRQVGTGSASQAPTWDTLAASDITSGTLAVARGGTNLGSYTTGDLLYASGTTTLAALADVATGNVLLSGGAGVAPSYGKVVFGTHTSGTNSVSQGGTGATTLTGYVYGNGTGAMTASTTIPNSATTATSANTASAIVARDASGNFTAGTITAALSGNATTATTAGTVTTATQNSITSIPNLATVGTITSGTWSGSFGAVSGANLTTLNASNLASGTVATARLASGTASSSTYLRGDQTWATIASPGDGTLTMGTSGVGLSGSATFTANQSGASTFTVTSNATSANTASTIVARDASGNFTAGTITAALNGNASTATSATSATTATTAGSCSGNSATATLATKASTLSQGGGNGSAMTFNWSGQSGQPTWLWGSNDGTNIYVWNPSNFSVNYATSAGSASSASSASTATTASAVSLHSSNEVNIGGGLTGGGRLYVNYSDGGSFTEYGFYGGNTSLATLVASSFSGAGTGLTGTASGLSIGGSAASATTATTATTANALNTSNNYQVNSLGVGTAGSGTAGEIRATNNITAYYSDERLKTKIGSIENALEKVKQIETMVYHANETAVELGYDASKIEVGVTAQSVQRVQPEAVKPAPIDEKYLTVQYERLVPLLIEAIKELEAQVAKLKAK